MKEELENGVSNWMFSSSQNVKDAAQKIEHSLRKLHQKLPRRVETPICTDHRPCLGLFPELGPQ